MALYVHSFLDQAFNHPYHDFAAQSCSYNQTLRTCSCHFVSKLTPFKSHISLHPYQSPQGAVCLFSCQINLLQRLMLNISYFQKSATSQLAWHSQQLNGQHLQVETYSTPCIIMTLHQCPDKSVYDKEIKQCVSQDNDNISKLCNVKQK